MSYSRVPSHHAKKSRSGEAKGRVHECYACCSPTSVAPRSKSCCAGLLEASAAPAACAKKPTTDDGGDDDLGRFPLDIDGPFSVVGKDNDSCDRPQLSLDPDEFRSIGSNRPVRILSVLSPCKLSSLARLDLDVDGEEVTFEDEGNRNAAASALGDMLPIPMWEYENRFFSFSSGWPRRGESGSTGEPG